MAVMALEADSGGHPRRGGVARMSDLYRWCSIMDAVTIPVMAKARIGALRQGACPRGARRRSQQESEVLTPADEDKYHCDKHDFKVPFVCGARDLGEALRHIAEGRR